MKKRKLILYIAFLVFCLNQKQLFAESEKDSLESILPFANDKDRCDILNSLSLTFKVNDTTKAASYARQSLALSNKLNYCRGKATATIILGIFCKDRNDFLGAQQKYLEGLAMALKCKEPYSIALAYHSLGNLSLIKGAYPVALRYYIASLKISEQLNDYRRIAKTLTNIATIYFDMHDLDLSEEYYLRAAKLHEALNDELTTAELCNNLANIYHAQEYDLKALFHYTKALKAFRKYGSIYDISSVLNNIGVIYQHRNQPLNAKPFLIESYNLDLETKDYKALALVCTNLSTVYIKTANTDSAFFYIDYAIELAIKNNFIPELAEAYRIKASIYKWMENNQMQAKYFTLYEKTKAKIINKESKLEINSLQNEYEAEKKAVELKLANKENELQATKISEQKAQLARKNLIIVLGGTMVFFLAVIISMFVYLLGVKKQSKMVELTSAAKSNLLNRLNHEIRTPLNSIVGMSQLAVESKNFTELKEYLTNIKLSTDELTFILNNIINYLQLDKSPAKMVAVPYHFTDTIQELFKIYAQQCKYKGILFTHTVYSGVPVDIMADKLKITSIINNLFFNALQQTQTGVVNIKVKQIAKKKVEDKEYSSLQIIVTDEGKGLTDSEIKNIFNPGQTNKEFGLGLGLKIVKEFSKSVNGHLSVTSEVGKGSVFRFEFDVELVEPALVQAEKDMYIPHGQICVLVVEDNLINQKLLVKILEKENINVVTANNGNDALEKIKEKNFDAMLLDLSLPELHGFEVAYKIRNEEEYSADKNMPIIAISANEDINEYKKCIEIGINEYLAKPINKELLLKYLAVLTHSQQQSLKNMA